MQQITWTKSNILDWYIPHRTRTLNADHTSSVTFKYRTLRIDSVFECCNLVRVSFVSLTFKYGFLFYYFLKRCKEMSQTAKKTNRTIVLVRWPPIYERTWSGANILIGHLIRVEYLSSYLVPITDLYPIKW